jgi:hypothetical protein
MATKNKNKNIEAVKIFEVDNETKILHKGEEKTLLELKNVFNYFVNHDADEIKNSKEIIALVEELKEVIDANDE